MKIQNTPNRAAFDVGNAQDVRDAFRNDPKAGLKAAAQQFETLFLQMVLKSMRDTVPQDGMMESEQSRFYTGLLDQQLAQNLASSGNGVGFAKLIEEQLGRHLASGGDPESLLDPAKAAGKGLPFNLPGTFDPGRGTSLSSGVPAAQSPVSAEGGMPQSATPAEFANRVWPHAVEASRVTGIPPQFLVAHAALETGWGRSEPRRADGSPSHNLFGIKAGKNWGGESVETATTEFIGGQPQQLQERFRAYGSYREAFMDYANLLRNTPRYAGVIASQDGTEFARRLQEAGYATDPQYAEKLARIIHGPTLRQALIG